MNFNSILCEAVIYNEKMIKIKNELEKELLSDKFIKDFNIMNVYFVSNLVVEELGYKLLISDNTDPDNYEYRMKGTGRATPKYKINNNNIDDVIEIRSDKLQKEVSLTSNKDSIIKFIKRFIQILMHELVHIQQYNRSTEEEYPEKYKYKKNKDDSNYYKRKDETMAFALQAAKEMKDKGYSKNRMLIATKKDFEDLYDVREDVDWNSVFKNFYNYVSKYYEEL